MDDSLDPETRGWIEQVCGSRLVGASRMDRWRPTWWIEVEGSVAGPRLVLKNARAPQHVTERSAMLSQFGIDREAAVLQVLSARGLAVPGFVGHRVERQQLLIGRVAGSAELQGVTDVARRERAMAEYGAALARVHALDWRAEGLEALRDPSAGQLPGPLAAVVEDSTRWDSPADPLLDLALEWMRTHRPDGLREVLLHGDAGANQFLFGPAGELTAMLDWELAYIGDPMSDLAYARYRDALYPSGAYPALVDAWARESGQPVDVAVLNWYTVAACLVMLIGIARDARRPRAANVEAVQRLWWDAISRVALCQVLAEDAGDPPVLPFDPLDDIVGEGAAPQVADLLVQRLSLQEPVSGDPRSVREHRHDLALATALLRSTRTPATALPPGADLAALTQDALIRMAVTAPLAISDTWGELGAPDAQEWRVRLTRPVLPRVGAAVPAS